MAGCLTVQSLNQDNLQGVVAMVPRVPCAHSFALTGATRPSLPVGERKRGYQATLPEWDAISLTPGFSQVWYTHPRATSR